MTIQEHSFFSLLFPELRKVFSIHETLLKDFHCIFKFSKTNDEREREKTGEAGIYW
jgi:hypothetical protein